MYALLGMLSGPRTDRFLVGKQQGCRTAQQIVDQSGGTTAVHRYNMRPYRLFPFETVPTPYATAHINGDQYAIWKGVPTCGSFGTPAYEVPLRYLDVAALSSRRMIQHIS